MTPSSKNLQNLAICILALAALIHLGLLAGWRWQMPLVPYFFDATVGAGWISTPSSEPGTTRATARTFTRANGFWCKMATVIRFPYR